MGYHESWMMVQVDSEMGVTVKKKIHKQAAAAKKCVNTFANLIYNSTPILHYRKLTVYK